MTDNLFKNYFTDQIYDEMLSRGMEVKPNWRTLLSNIEKIGSEGLISRQNDLTWHLVENGVTYNVYNDPQGLNRPWNLDVMPFIIHDSEWQIIEKGLKQRAYLLNLMLKDIYGERELIKKGILPQEVIYSHRGFLRACDKIQYNTNNQLLIHSADMSRGPDGRIWLINDRTQAPSGMGYALENRLTMGRVLPELTNNIHVKKLSGFFQDFNDLLVKSTPGNKENPNIVILTPGPHNETYFEHAYLASFLGYSLVQGNDLVVRDGHLWMKSLKGLKQIDVLLRRVDDMYMDPLELREDSHLGVAGLLDVIRRKNVTIVNPIGIRVLENPGLIPFMNAISKYYLNEDLILPQIATWWCGQEKEKKYVLENLSQLIIKRIDRSNSGSIFFGYEMTYQQLDDLKKEISDRPYRFVAQEKVSFSTTPTFVNGHFEPRNSVWRSFAISNNKDYSVMPGGQVRVAAERGNINVSNQRGGASKDIWISSQNEDNSSQLFFQTRKSTVSMSGFDDLPSFTAENLFWAGRYVARTLSVARFMRTVLKQMSYNQFNEYKPEKYSLQLLFQAATQITATYPGFVGKGKEEKFKDPFPEILSIILDKDRFGSLAFTIAMFSNSYFAIRNLWSDDMWRVFDRIDKIWKNLQNDNDKTIRKIIQALDQIITRLIAFMGLIEESILIDQGLLLYFIGLQMEQSMLNIAKNRALLSTKHDEQVEYEILESLLNSHESLNIYRYSYRSYLRIQNVIDLILLDMKYPRSLAYQLNRLIKDLGELPHSKISHDLTNYEKLVFEAFSILRLANSNSLTKTKTGTPMRTSLDKMLAKISELLNCASIEITNTYFSHTHSQNQLVNQNQSL